MADRGLRQLERLASQGDTEAEVAWCQERIRIRERGPLPCKRCNGTGRLRKSIRSPLAGDVGCDDCDGTGLAPFSESLKLAAYCQSEVARRVSVGPKCRYCSGAGYREWLDDEHICTCQDPPFRPPCGACTDAPEEGWPLHRVVCPSCNGAGHLIESPNELPAWLSGLKRWPSVVSMRAAVAAGWVAHKRRCLARCRVVDPGEHNQECRTSRRALGAAERWLEDPSEENLEAWEQAWLAIGPPELASFVPVPPGILNETVRPTTIEVVASLTCEATVREAICEALCKWALR